MAEPRKRVGAPTPGDPGPGGSDMAAPEPAAPKPAAPIPQDFETALAQLEALVASMEDGELSLQDSLSAYKRGVALSRVCQDRLAQAEHQVKVLEGELLKPLGAANFEDDSTE